MSVQEVEQDPFDPEEFVERLAWRTANSNRSGPAAEPNFDPVVLETAFNEMIAELKEEDKRYQKRAEKLEHQVKEEEKSHWLRVSDLQKKNQEAFSRFQELDERINYVATKVVHLGDQLESVNAPRARAAQAQQLMKYFKEFLERDLQSDIFTDPTQIFIGADIIQKLYQIAQDLPPSDQFTGAKLMIEEKYKEIENNLTEQFVKAYQAADKRKMKRTTNTLANFKGYSVCIDVFIEESQKYVVLKKDIFSDILRLCIDTSDIIGEVFANQEDVMARFVLNVYHGKLREYIDMELQNKSDQELYLENLHSLYTKTVKLSNQLSSKLNLGSDPQYLHKLTKNLFTKDLDLYISFESKFLVERCSAVLERYYDNKGHIKKRVEPVSIVNELRRDLQQKMNLGSVDSYGGEVFLSHEVAISILQESKNAFKRCKALSSIADLPGNAVKIFDCLVQYLCTEHIEYAIELALQAIPPPEPKVEPDVYFFSVAEQANTIFHLFQKQFCDNLIPLVSSSPFQSECIRRMKMLQEDMEVKLANGLERSVQTIIGWIKFMLTSEQKRTDFKPENEESAMLIYTQACTRVTKYVETMVQLLKRSLDGKNVEAVLTEFGSKFHRLVYDHLLQFQYNSLGAMIVICDVNEYRKSVRDFNIPIVTHLFTTLHALCNLLVVVPENLSQVCTGEQLVGLDRNILHNFVQLRADYRPEKLALHFK